MVTCYLTRYVSTGYGFEARFVKKANLPIAPFPGLEMMLDGGEPTEVESVMINHAGEVVVEFGELEYEPEGYNISSPEEAADLMSFHVAGWTKLENGEDCGAASIIHVTHGCKPLQEIVEARGPWNVTVPMEG